MAIVEKGETLRKSSLEEHCVLWKLQILQPDWSEGCLSERKTSRCQRNNYGPCVPVQQVICSKDGAMTAPILLALLQGDLASLSHREVDYVPFP